jgi:hypothetical protein
LGGGSEAVATASLRLGTFVAVAPLGAGGVTVSFLGDFAEAFAAILPFAERVARRARRLVAQSRVRQGKVELLNELQRLQNVSECALKGL